nr:GGDEF domain-containing protein [uncultured Blautia sp.]
MKKIALITDGWKRYVTYAWVQGYRRYASQYHLDTDLYVFQSFGNFNTDEGYNSGEYNITRLPDLRTFDGIILDLSNVSDASLKESFLARVRESGVPAISLLEDLPGLYYSGLDNLTDFGILVEHLITEHGCRKLNYVGASPRNQENQKRLLAYRKTLEKHGILFEPERVIERSFEIKTGIRAFTEFQQKDLLPEAFVCASDNIAVGVCLAAREAGFSIPEDFLVTGFDNEDKASYCNPRITTADFSKTEIMYHAMELLVDIWNGQTDRRCTYTQAVHIFQESCRCVSECPPDRGQYIIKRILSEARQSDMQNWMIDLNRFLLDCTSYTDLTSHMQMWLHEHQFGNLYLLMNPDIFHLEKVDILPEIPDDIYRCVGYPDKMTVVHPVSDTEAVMQLSITDGHLLPDITRTGDQNIFVFAPLHFREREVGYVVLQNCDYLLDHQFLFKMLNSFRTALESLYNKLVLCKKNKQLSQLYIHDSLTGLYNRMAYENLALPLFQKYMQKKKHLGILFVDADHLKYINDNFGHDMGNLAIRSIASAIHKSCPVGSVCMRYGGDEFVCVIPDFDLPRMHRLEKTILHALEEISDVSRFPFPLEASIGSVIADDAVFSLNDYINLADQKMYASKKARKAAREEAKN